MKTSRRFFMTTARLHIWLGWLIGIPLLLWTISGLFMVSQPIEKIRGNHLKAPPAAIVPFNPVAPPSLQGRAIISANLVQQPDGPVWIITFQDGDKKRASGKTGDILPPLTAIKASAFAQNAYAGEAALKGVTHFAADANPLELRRGRPAWQAVFGDGTHIYIDAESGETLATRTGLWRAFDFMWGLHIMDLQKREDTSHPILILFAALALIGTLFGSILLFRKRKSRSKKKVPSPSMETAPTPQAVRD